jgi:hypothetical protein
MALPHLHLLVIQTVRIQRMIPNLYVLQCRMSLVSFVVLSLRVLCRKQGTTVVLPLSLRQGIVGKALSSVYQRTRLDDTSILSLSTSQGGATTISKTTSVGVSPTSTDKRPSPLSLRASRIDAGSSSQVSNEGRAGT